MVEAGKQVMESRWEIKTKSLVESVVRKGQILQMLCGKNLHTQHIALMFSERDSTTLAEIPSSQRCTSAIQGEGKAQGGA